ncbi:MAG: hypothetical protein EOO71_08960 [Myxococcaceae bacterium]|nr:MAG: hypothetical protein EOO71_08960 [Myxococcaceae bacterium]
MPAATHRDRHRLEQGSERFVIVAYREKVPPSDGCRACTKSFGRTRQACLYHAIGYAVAEVGLLNTRLALLTPYTDSSGSEGGEQ